MKKFLLADRVEPMMYVGKGIRSVSFGITLERHYFTHSVFQLGPARVCVCHRRGEGIER